MKAVHHRKVNRRTAMVEAIMAAHMIQAGEFYSSYNDFLFIFGQN
jgi:hypothetical protein